MRRPRGPNWPTHRRRRALRSLHAPRTTQATSRSESPQAAARRLVRDGLANPLILGPRKPEPEQERGPQ